MTHEKYKKMEMKCWIEAYTNTPISESRFVSGNIAKMALEDFHSAFPPPAEGEDKGDKKDFIPYQCCPVCNGNKWVTMPYDPYKSTVMSNAPCTVCNGAGIIPMGYEITVFHTQSLEQDISLIETQVIDGIVEGMEQMRWSRVFDFFNEFKDRNHDAKCHFINECLEQSKVKK
jgi:hypothetical protein